MNSHKDAGDEGATATDRLLRGRLVLQQPRAGHRAGTDAVLLAAASGVVEGDRFIDVGAGVGTVGLAVALQQPACQGVLLELDGELAALAQANAEANGVGDRVTVTVRDLFAPSDREPDLLVGSASLVISNPPFFLDGQVRSSPQRNRSVAHVLPRGTGAHRTDHADWVRHAASFLAPHGRIIVIHRPEALPGLIQGLGAKLGGFILRAIHPHADRAAHRILLGAQFGSRAPAVILPPLILHRADGHFTPEAHDLHEGASMRFWTQKNRPQRAGST